MNLFYCPDLNADEIILPPTEAHHIFHVMRLKESDVINITDGKGLMLTARLTEVSKKAVTAHVTETIKTNPRKHSLHIAIAPTKNIDRLEWFIEKATEIGIETITPLLCQRSERKEVKNERLEKVVIAAAKQSQKAFFPVLKEMISFKEFITTKTNGHRFIAHCMNDEKHSLKTLEKSPDSVIVLIGPEGDFSPSELEAAKQNGFSSLSLGESRMRTETAALMACASFNFAIS